MFYPSQGDIRELDEDQATTAYGALVDVPGCCDMLVAGTSCVDYSNLNNEQKEITEQGESGQTFRGHVFSCEIEPFKQAYIERNFAPPILFRTYFWAFPKS